MLQTTLLVLCFVYVSLCHMHLDHPPPLNGPNNPFTEGQGETYIDNPYGCCGKPIVGACHGQLDLLGTYAASPVVSWEAGSTQNFSLNGEGNHYGGSCQVGFSIDNGTTFQVATSFEGNCPHRKGGTEPEGQTFEFHVPRDIPAGQAIFAWTWINREQEFSMNCAVVTITGSEQEPNSDPDTKKYTDCTCTCDNEGCSCECPGIGEIKEAYVSTKDDAISQQGQPRGMEIGDVRYFNRPKMLYANVENGCSSPRDTAELKYPDPGPDLTIGDGEYMLELPFPAEDCANTYM